MMTYDELDRRCKRLTQINYEYRELVTYLRAENTELKRLLSEAGIVIVPFGMITDGFGNVYPKHCVKCGAPMQIIRPGDCRCSRCDL